MKKRLVIPPRLRKILSLTMGLSGFYMLLLVVSACETDPSLQNPFGECGPAAKADAVDISVFFSPYENETYATESDTVQLKDFAFNFQLIPEVQSSSEKSIFPGRAYALSCAQTFDFQNISNITIILKKEFNNLPVGTDILFLLELPDGSTLDQLRDFKKSTAYYSYKLNIVPENFSQLETQTFLFLRDGTRIVVDSTSPYIKTI